MLNDIHTVTLAINNTPTETPRYLRLHSAVVPAPTNMRYYHKWFRFESLLTIVASVLLFPHLQYTYYAIIENGRTEGVYVYDTAQLVPIRFWSSG